MNVTLRPALPLLLAAACIEHHAPSETSPVVFDHVNVQFDDRNGFFPTLFLEGATGVHVVYLSPDVFDYAFPGKLTYAGCAGGCEDAASWNWGSFDSSVVSHPAAVLTSTGAHAAYVVQPDENVDSGVVRVATCEAQCARAGGWRTVDVAVAGGFEEETMALTSDASGTLYLAFTDSRPSTGATRVRVLRCDTGCAIPSNFRAVTVDSFPKTSYWTYVSLSSSAMIVDPAGRVHLAFGAYNQGRLIVYATCGGVCATRESWHVVTLDSSSAWYGPPAIALTPSGGLVVAFGRTDSTIVMFCDAACEDQHNWRSVSPLARAGGTALSVGPGGELHLVVEAHGFNVRGLTYGRCLHACDVASNWAATILDTAASDIAGANGLSIALDQQDNPRIAYSYWSVIRLSILR